MPSPLQLCLSFAVLLLLVPASGGQSTPAPATAAKAAPDRFAAEPYVVQNHVTLTTLHADGTDAQQQTITLKLQTQAALQQFSVIGVSFESLSQTAAITYARVRHPDGTIVETPVSGAIEQPAQVTQQAPNYSDLYTRQLPIKDLRVGDVLEWQTLVTTTKPDVPGQSFGQASFVAGVVVLHETHELRYPASMPVHLWTDPAVAVAASAITEGTERVARWHHEELQPTVGAAADAARKTEQHRLLTPAEELDATHGKLPSLAWTTFPDWAAVGAWYRALTADRAIPDPTVRAKVDELVAGQSTPLARAQAVYTYVAHIHYIGVAFGIGRLQPHTAAEVLANQYGDCKDKHVLLAAMLAAAGLQADPVLIGAGIRFNPAVPSPLAFNHLITRARVDGQQVWLDTTAEVAPWGALLAVTRDHEALEIPPDTPAIVVRTPELLPFPSTETWKITGTLDNSLTSRSQFTTTYHDDVEIVLRAVLRRISPAQYGAFVQQLMANQGFGGTTSDATIEHLDDASQPIVVSFTYDRQQDKSWGENRITMPFEGLGMPYFTADQPPTSTIDLATPRTLLSTVELALPPGWGADLPQPTHATASFATCDVTYRMDGRKLFAERRLVVLRAKVPVADFPAYRDWFDHCEAGGVPFVQLKPSATAAILAAAASDSPPTTSTTQTPAPTQAATLVAEARKIMLGNDPVATRKLLDQARALNPNERGLWMGYAAVAAQIGEQGEAVADLKKELALYPGDPKLYRYLIQQEDRQGDRASAVETARAWEKTSPTDPAAALALVGELAATGRTEDAVATGRAALARLRSTQPDADTTELQRAVAELERMLRDRH